MLNKQDKSKLFIMLTKQFPLALKAIQKRCEVGHIKYAHIDQDYQGFTRTPYEEYPDAIIRHLMQDGEPEETELDHLSAVAWNAVAMLEIKLREINGEKR